VRVLGCREELLHRGVLLGTLELLELDPPSLAGCLTASGNAGLLDVDAGDPAQSRATGGHGQPSRLTNA